MEFGGFKHLVIEQDGAALVVTVNRPEALNALSQSVVREFERLVTQLEMAGTDAKWPIRGVIITGGGEKSFVAGADIAEMNAMSPDQALAYGQSMQDVTLRMERLPLPVIAAVNGFALGGGCELAMACDFIYASERASFGQPEVNLGLVPGFGGSVRLQQRVGVGMARELIFTGRRIKADEALRIGLVNRLFGSVEEMLDAAKATIAEISEKSPTAIANAKSAMHSMIHLSVEEGLAEEARSFYQAFHTEDSVEGRTAFLEKRSPQWLGR
ncbi:enoyl-CoA hydratase/isomerase family protein [Neomicrococcus lactis]